MAKLRLSDLQIPENLAQKSELEQIIGSAHPYEIRRPLALLGPTELTRSIKKLVIEYFNSTHDISVQASPQGLQFGVLSKSEDNIDFDPTETQFGQKIVSKPGPRTGRDIKKEEHAAKCIGDLASGNPGCRLIRDNAFEALQSIGFSHAAAKRIWEVGAPAKWQRGGRPRDDQPRFEPKDLISLYEKTNPPGFS